MIISTTLMKPDSRLVFHKGKIIVFDDVDELNEKLKDVRKQIDAEIEQEIEDVVKKVLKETKCILKDCEINEVEKVL